MADERSREDSAGRDVWLVPRIVLTLLVVGGAILLLLLSLRLVSASARSTLSDTESDPLAAAPGGRLDER